jgi:glycosyltransferase involved in cell wall biosynthesis
MRVAFYAPLKPPDHAVPSGDRAVARLMRAALEAAGHETLLASTFRSFEGAGDGQRQRALQAEGEAEARRLVATYGEAAPERRPEAWFTYHLYHKAPDWLGPEVCRALGIPYLVAEAAHAPKQADGPWALSHAAAASAIAGAAVVLCATAIDEICLEPLMAPDARLTRLPPFLDTAPFVAASRRRSAARETLAAQLGLDPGKRWLLSVAMMRAGDKLASYRELAAALAILRGDDWRLVVVGDGAAESEVRTALTGLGEGRVFYAGSRAAGDLAAVYAACDLYVWPAVNEAYGMALLEAQAAGLPVVAGRIGGVPDVVRDGEAGHLIAAGDVAALAAAVRVLLDDDDLRARLGRQAQSIVEGEHGLARAAARLDDALRFATRARAAAAS